MNEPFGNSPFETPNQNPPAQPSGWTPQQTPPPAPMPAAGNTYETPAMPDITGPMEPIPGPDEMYEPEGPKSNGWLFIILGILVVIGGIILASWMGWLDFAKLFNFSSKTATTDTTLTETPTETPTTPVVNANDAQRKTDLANLKTALAQYFNDHQAYPTAATIQKTSDANTALKALVPTYIVQLPVDPLSPNNYYGYQSDGKSFQLSAVLEDTTDTSGIQVGNYFLYKVTDTSVETPVAAPAATIDNSQTPSEVAPTDESGSVSADSGTTDTGAEATAGQ